MFPRPIFLRKLLLIFQLEERDQLTVGWINLDPLYFELALMGTAYQPVRYAVGNTKSQLTVCAVFV